MKKSWAILVFAVLGLALSACGRTETPVKRPVSIDVTAPSRELPTAATTVAPILEGQLYCSVGSQEDAQKIAELYGITLLEYRGQLALFYTEEDPRTVIERGKSQGWPLLTQNQKLELF